MLQNAYSLAKIGADAAENDRNFAEIVPKICQKLATRPPTTGDLHRELFPAVGWEGGKYVRSFLPEVRTECKTFSQ